MLLADSKDFKHIDKSIELNFIGTEMFASINSHKKIT